MSSLSLSLIDLSSFLIIYDIHSKSLDEGETDSSAQNDAGGGSLGPQHEAAAVSSHDEHTNTTRSPTSSSQEDSERPNSQKKSASPPVVSSTTTTATTPPSSPRTGTGSNFSSPDLKAPVSPRATLHAAAAAKAVGTKHEHTSIIRGSAVSGTDASSALAEVEQDTTNVLEHLPPGVVQQYSSKEKADLTSADSLVSIKMLVSNNVAGSIIGRSGQSISELQAQSSSRIKLSQAGDFYPGTLHRVCLIQGDQAQVKAAISLIIKRIDELQKQAEQRGKQQPHRHEEEEEDQVHGAPSTSNDEKEDADAEDESLSLPSFIVRVLVPTPACGMIIGRGGSNIKNMAELSGVSSIRLSPKEYGEHLMQQGASPHHHYHHSRHLHLQQHPQQRRRQQQHSDTPGGAATVTNERIVTISGPSLSSAISCVDLIIDGIAAHPEIGRYANMTTSYSRASSAASATLTSRLALQSSTTSRPTSGPFYAPAGPYSTARSAPTPPPIANAIPGTSLTSMMMSPPSPMVQGHPHRQYGGNSSAHGHMDSLGSSQQQQAIHYHSPHHSQHVHTPSSVTSPHHMYPGTPAAPIPTLNQPTYVPLSPQHIHRTTIRQHFCKVILNNSEAPCTRQLKVEVVPM